MENSEWTDWIKHDGNGCPCIGQFVHVVYFSGREEQCYAGHAFNFSPYEKVTSWHWAPSTDFIKRYRIRKPKGLIILEEIMKDIGDLEPVE